MNPRIDPFQTDTTDTPDIPETDRNYREIINGDTARTFLEQADANGIFLRYLDNGIDPVTGYDHQSRIVYYDGDGTGGEIDLPTGGLICENVPKEIAPVFSASLDLAYTVTHHEETLGLLRDHIKTHGAIDSEVFESIVNRFPDID